MVLCGDGDKISARFIADTARKYPSGLEIRIPTRIAYMFGVPTNVEALIIILNPGFYTFQIQSRRRHGTND